MRKATATYNAPEGDSDVVEMAGVAFKSGEAVDLNSDEHGHLLNKLPKNKHFYIDIGEDDSPPPVAEDGFGKMKIDELRRLADERGIDHEGKSKAELREVLSQ